MTNFEKIKQMTVEEFSEAFADDNLCSYIQKVDPKQCLKQHEICIGCIKDWLNQEVKENE